MGKYERVEVQVKQPTKTARPFERSESIAENNTLVAENVVSLPVKSYSGFSNSRE